MRKRPKVVPAGYEVLGDHKKVPYKQAEVRRYTPLLFLPGILAPCIIATALYNILDAGVTLRYLLPLIAFGGWGLSALYALVLHRSLVTDISPWLVLPLGIVYRMGQVGRAAKGTARWTRKMATGDHNGQGEITSAENFVPRAFDVLLEHEPTMRKIRQYQYAVLGWNHRRTVYADWIAAKHILIQGTTGVGKTTVALTIMLSMLGAGPSIFSRWRFHVHDAKGVMGHWFTPLAQMYPEKFHVSMTMADALSDMRKLYADMEARGPIIGTSGGRMRPEDAGLDRVIILIDEPQMWYDKAIHRDEAREYEAYVKQIVNAGRQLGFHVVLITPYALREVISTQYRGNFKVVTGHLKKNTVQSHGIQGVDTLGEYEFAYEERPTDNPTFFRSFVVDDTHLERVMALFKNGDGYVKGADEAMLYIFANTQNCGYRTIQKEGRLFYEASLSHHEEIPFPFNKIEIKGKKPFPSRAAREWIENTMAAFVKAGIAKPQGRGQAHKFLLGSYAEALQVWREYRAQNN